MRRCILLGLLMIACAPPSTNVGGTWVTTRDWQSDQRTLIYLATADMGPCSRWFFDVIEQRKGLAVRVAARGCWKFAVYEKRARGKVSYKYSAAWTLVSKRDLYADQGMQLEPVPATPSSSAPGAAEAHPPL